MATQRSTSTNAAATPPLSTDMASSPASQPAKAALHRLPARLLELVLQRLSLAEQLSYCTHLCKLCPPPTAISLRHSTVLLNDDAVRRFSLSPRLHALLAAATSIIVPLDPRRPSSCAVLFSLDAARVDALFPQLARISFRLFATVSTPNAHHGAHYQLQCLTPFLPLLSRRSLTLHTVHIAPHSEQPLLSLAFASVLPLLARLTALRRLKMAVSLTQGQLGQMLLLPLEVLDLTDSTLCDEYPHPQLTNVADCALLRSVRVLRLPQCSASDHPASGNNSLDALLSERASDSLPHTLSVQHTMSAAAGQQLIDAPPSRSLSVHVHTGVARGEVFLQLAAASDRWMDLASDSRLQLHLHCHLDRLNMQPFVDCVKRHRQRIRSITVEELPLGEYTTELLGAISLCANLTSLRLFANGTSWRKAMRRTPLPRWEGRPVLSRLHTICLIELCGAETLLCRLLAACPALRVCILRTLDLSVGMLNVLSASCPLLSHLQLRIMHDSAISARPPTADEEASRPATPFPSLGRLDVQYATTHNGRPGFLAVLSQLHSYLLGGPLRQLTLTLRCKDQSGPEVAATSTLQYKAAVVPLLLALPRLEKLTVGRDWPMALTAAALAVDDNVVTKAWDEEEDEDDGRVMMEEQAERGLVAAGSLPSTRLTTAADLNAASAASQVSASLRSLDLIVAPDLLPLEDLDTLLTHCPAVTSVKLTVRDGHHSALLHFLHCLALIGLHCPLVEDITYQLDRPQSPHIPGSADYNRLQRTPAAVQELGVVAVRGVVDQYQQQLLSGAAFGRLLELCEAGPASEVLSDEAAAFVRQQWMRSVRDVARLTWHRTSLASQQSTAAHS